MNKLFYLLFYLLFHLLVLTEENKVLDLDHSDLGLSH